jgi:hypothetical protein
MVFETANITDLRFKTDEVLKKSKKMVWILRNGKKVALLVDASKASKMILEDGRLCAFPSPKGKKKIPADVALKKYQFPGPTDLSSRVDEYAYQQ